jgi:hypothetical protein
MADQIMLQRYNLMDLNSSDRVYMQRFFNVTGIHPHAMSMRRATAQVFMQRYIPKIAQRALGSGPKAILARQALGELGLDAKNLELVRELKSLGNIQTAQQLDKLRHLDAIRTAINRFTDSAVMDPKAIDKPRMATMPEYSFMYGILSFQFAYQRHVRTGDIGTYGWAPVCCASVAVCATSPLKGEADHGGQNSSTSFCGCQSHRRCGIRPEYFRTEGADSSRQPPCGGGR